MEAYGKENEFGNENSNFDKPSTIHSSLLGFELQKFQMHAQFKQIDEYDEHVHMQFNL
jgi:hypothetical protein